MSKEYINQMSKEYINQMSIEYINQMNIEYINQISKEYINQMSIEYINQMSKEYINQMSLEYINQMSKEYINQNFLNVLFPDRHGFSIIRSCLYVEPVLYSTLKHWRNTTISSFLKHYGKVKIFLSSEVFRFSLCLNHNFFLKNQIIILGF